MPRNTVPPTVNWVFPNQQITKQCPRGMPTDQPDPNNSSGETILDNSRLCRVDKESYPAHTPKVGILPETRARLSPEMNKECHPSVKVARGLEGKILGDMHYSG